MYLSTLRSYVEAIGRELDVILSLAGGRRHRSPDRGRNGIW
jgi:hypothetical protein